MRLVIPLLLCTLLCSAAEPEERWDGTIVFGSLKLPFSFQLNSSKDGAATARFTNLGEPGKGASGAGSLRNDALALRLDNGAAFEAAVDGGSMKGQFIHQNGRYKFEAARFCTCGFQGEAGPDISGSWTIAGASSGTLTILRKGEDTIATLRISSNVSALPPLAGRFDGAVFTLSYFNGDPAGAAWLEIEPDKDASVLTLVFQTPASGQQLRLRATRTRP